MSGFVVAISGAIIIQEVVLSGQAKNPCTVTTRNSSQSSPLNNFEKIRIQHQLYVASRSEIKREKEILEYKEKKNWFSFIPREGFF